jgi:hypothetical protein
VPAIVPRVRATGSNLAAAYSRLGRSQLDKLPESAVGFLLLSLLPRLLLPIFFAVHLQSVWWTLLLLGIAILVASLIVV